MRFLFALVLCLLPFSAAAQNRLALVIDNDGYTDVPALAKARADAQAIGARLNELGFTITRALDQDLVHAREAGLKAEGARGHVQPPHPGPSHAGEAHRFFPLLLEVPHPRPERQGVVAPQRLNVQDLQTR